MKLIIDHHNLLCIQPDDVPQTKEYANIVSGYYFSDYDKGLVVLHKKDFKIVHLKNLGDTMSVVYCIKRPELSIPFDQEGFIKGLCLFDSFDEITGKKYYFIPKLSDKDGEIIKNNLNKLGLGINIEKTDKGYIVVGENANTKDSRGKYISFLFALTLVYGKMDIKNGELISIKIHIPLFGQFLKYEENFDSMKKNLAREGIFINTSVQKNDNSLVYQINCNDYEVLKQFAEYYKAIENIEKISKCEFVEEMKNKLLAFLVSDPSIPNDGKTDVLENIENGIIKFLMK